MYLVVSGYMTFQTNEIDEVLMAELIQNNVIAEVFRYSVARGTFTKLYINEKRQREWKNVPYRSEPLREVE